MNGHFIGFYQLFQKLEWLIIFTLQDNILGLNQLF